MEWDEIYRRTCEKLRGNLSVEEYEEMIGLEYVLTMGYSKNENRDEKRYIKLINKKYKTT